jgi:hypothetical protein
MIVKFSSAKLEKRHRQSAVVSTMFLTVSAAMRKAYRRKKNLGALFEEMLVVMAIRKNDDGLGNPLTIACLAKILNMPRSNVKRAAEALVGEGLIRKEGAAFVGDLEYLAANQEAEYFKVAVSAILEAADTLRKL